MASFVSSSKPFVNSWQSQRQNPAASDSRPEGGPSVLVSLVYLVSLVSLICFVRPVGEPDKPDQQNKRDKPNQPNRPNKPARPPQPLSYISVLSQTTQNPELITQNFPKGVEVGCLRASLPDLPEQGTGDRVRLAPSPLVAPLPRRSERKPSGIPLVTVVPTVILRSVPAFLPGSASADASLLRSCGETQRHPCGEA